jgi:hypothetical protein
MTTLGKPAGDAAGPRPVILTRTGMACARNGAGEPNDTLSETGWLTGISHRTGKGGALAPPPRGGESKRPLGPEATLLQGLKPRNLALALRRG